MSRRQWAKASAIVGALLIACSDSSDDSLDGSLDACAPIEPCGGDLVGTWRIDASCSSTTEAQAIDTLEEELPPECSGSLDSAEVESSDVSITFDASGVINLAGTTSLRLRYTYDEACLAAMFGALGGANEESCRRLGPGMMGATEAGPLGVAACSFESGACACEFFFQPDVSASGTYALADSQLTVDDRALAHCVSGDTLHIGVPSIGASIARRQ